MNNIIIIGNLTRNPSIRTTQAGNEVATITVAVASSRKDKNGEYMTDFFNCECYGKTVEFVKNYLAKGTQVAVNGSIHIRDYETREGQKSKSVEIDVAKLKKLKDAPLKPVDEKPLPNLDEVVVPEDEDLPF